MAESPPEAPGGPGGPCGPGGPDKYLLTSSPRHVKVKQKQFVAMHPMKKYFCVCMEDNDEEVKTLWLFLNLRLSFSNLCFSTPHMRNEIVFYKVSATPAINTCYNIFQQVA